MGVNKTEPWEPFSKAVVIDAPVSAVWEALTNTARVNQWMSDEDFTITTDWKVGSSVVIQAGKHWVDFENKGTVLQVEPEKLLKYSHLSSLSQLPDEPQSYTLFEFKLSPHENQTTLVLTIEQFPTEAIYRHLVFYWATTLTILKTRIEHNTWTV